MNRRQFHKFVLAGAAAVAGPLVEAGESTQIAAGPIVSHPGEPVPAGAAGRFGTNRFWHVAEGGNDGVNALAFSPDGRFLASLGYEDGHVKLWEVPGGQLVRKWQCDKTGYCKVLAFSADGRMLAVGSEDGVWVWDPHTGQLIRTILHELRSGYVIGVAFSPDGKLVAGVVEYLGLVAVWDVATGELVRTFASDPHPRHPDDPYLNLDLFCSVAFSADGSRLAAGSQRRIWCWELASGERLAVLGHHDFPVTTVGFRPDGRLVSCAADGSVCVWDVPTGERVAEISPSAGDLDLAWTAITPDVCHVLLARAGYLGVVDLMSGAEVRRFVVDPTWGGSDCLALSSGARWVVTSSGGGGGQLSLWDATTGANVSPTGRHFAFLWEVRFSPDGTWIATISQYDAILWETATGRFLREIKFDRGRPDLTMLSPDGKRALCLLRHYGPKGESDSRLLTWDWDSGVARMWDDVQPTSAVWGADSNIVLYGTESGEIFTLDLESGKCGCLLDGLGPVGGLTVSANGKVAAAVADKRIHVWDLAGGGWRNCLTVAPVPATGSPFRWSSLVRLSHDGRRVAIMGNDQVAAGPVIGRELPVVFTAPIVKLRDDESLREFMVDFVADGRLLAVGLCGDPEDANDLTGYWRYTLRVWDVTSGRELWAAPPMRSTSIWLAFSPDGHWLATAEHDGTALLWPIGKAVTGGE